MIHKNFSSVNSIIAIYDVIFMQHGLGCLIHQVIFFLNLTIILIITGQILAKFKIAKSYVIKINIINFNKVIVCIKKWIFLKTYLNNCLPKFHYCFCAPILTKCQINSYVNEIYKVTENYTVNIMIYFTAFLIFSQTSEVKSLKFDIFLISYPTRLYINFKVKFHVKILKHATFLQNFPSVNVLISFHGS